MTDTSITSTGLGSSHFTYLRPNVARRWGCAPHTRSRPGPGGTGTVPSPIRQTCRVSARLGLPSLQATPSRQIEVSAHSTHLLGNCRLCRESQLVLGQSQELQIREIQRPTQHQQLQQLGSSAVRTVAAITAVASCLHAAPALADTAVEGAEQIAKSLSSSNWAMGRLQNFSVNVFEQCTFASLMCATWLQVHWALSHSEKDLCQGFCSYYFQNWVIRHSL